MPASGFPYERGRKEREIPGRNDSGPKGEAKTRKRTVSAKPVPGPQAGDMASIVVIAPALFARAALVLLVLALAEMAASVMALVSVFIFGHV